MTGTQVADALTRDFDFLRRFGLRVEESSVIEMGLVGPSEMLLWQGDGIEVRLVQGLGQELAPAALSINVASPRGNFTYTDWVHYAAEAETPTAPSEPDQSYIAAMAARVRASAEGELGKILSGTVWIDVPTYRGPDD